MSLSTFIPRGTAAVVEPKRFNAQLCGVCVVSAEEAEAIKLAPASVPGVFRGAIQGDCIVLAVDSEGNYASPRLRIDNTFKGNKAFGVTPKFSLSDFLTNACSEAGEISPELATKYAKTLRAKYEAEKASGKAAILAALMAVKS